MALNFPSSPSSGTTYNAPNGISYYYDGVKWISQGNTTSGALNAQKLDSITFNGTDKTFDLKIGGNIAKPVNAQAVIISVNNVIQEPGTSSSGAYYINDNGQIVFNTAPASNHAFFGTLLSRIPVENESSTTFLSKSGGTMTGNITFNSSQTFPGAEANVQADWNQSTTTDDSYIKNKPTIPAAQIQSDWNQSSSSAKDFIKNKPTVGDANVQSDWNQNTTSADDYIKNKPTIPTVENSFKTIKVSGQSDVVADSTTDTLEFVAGSNVTITTDASNDKITIASSGSGGGGGSDLTIQEEGSSLSTAATTLNFVGSKITASGTGATKTITVANEADASTSAKGVVQLETSTSSSSETKAATSKSVSDAVGLAVVKSTFDTKGDILVSTGNDAYSKLAAGTNTHVLTADSSEATGLKWAAVSGSGGSTSFVGLSDTPGNFTNAAGKYVVVNSAANALEYVTGVSTLDGGNFDNGSAIVSTSTTYDGGNFDS